MIATPEIAPRVGYAIRGRPLGGLKHHIPPQCQHLKKARAVLIPPAIPPLTPVDELIETLRTAPPLVAEPIDHDIIYGMCTVGDGGRIHDKHLLATLGWIVGTRLDIRCHPDGAVLVHPTEHGQTQVSANHNFRVPCRQRRIADLNVGDKALLAAHPSDQQLAIYPPPALHVVFGQPRIQAF
ncbi:hypothetical protein ACFWF7_21660 [Nocardia sp. NPDC060256]|uniref:hypothetical protein n=1 Tax=unclassified Nocardia TaxID=2637762 RepID=UPI00364FD106